MPTLTVPLHCTHQVSTSLPTGSWHYQPWPLPVPQHLSSCSPWSPHLTSFPQQDLHLLLSGLTSSFGHHFFLDITSFWETLFWSVLFAHCFPNINNQHVEQETTVDEQQNDLVLVIHPHTCTPSHLLPVGIDCKKWFFPITVSDGENQTLRVSRAVLISVSCLALSLLAQILQAEKGTSTFSGIFIYQKLILGLGK